MSIFTDIRDAIASSRATAKPPVPDGIDAPVEIGHQRTPRQAIEGTLAHLAQQRGAAFNWQESIVDLLKLLQLDSSLQSLQQLAEELGYQGERDGSPEMTDWLYSKVMAKLSGDTDIFGKQEAEPLPTQPDCVPAANSATT